MKKNEYWAKKKRERTRRKKEKIVEQKGGKCIKCGYKKSIAGLDFHHVSGEKESNIAKLMSKPIKEIEKELKKCILLCANCHRIEHNFLQEDRKDYQNVLRLFLHEKAGGECSNCKIDDKRVFVFHHIDKEDKQFAISKGISSRWCVKKVVKEVNKCSLLCENCHREHHNENEITIKKINITEKDVNIFLENHGKDKVCKNCNNMYKTTSLQNNFCKEKCEVEYKKKGLVNEYRKKCKDCKKEIVVENKGKNIAQNVILKV